MKETLWQKVQLDKYDKLEEDLETDVLVIGGGICGILCAYQLSKKYNVVLVEKNQIASGRTARTTAVITALQDIYYKDLIKRKGKIKAKLYLEANVKAIEEYQTLAEQYDFDFERVSSYKYFKNNEILMKQEYQAITDLGYPVKISDHYALEFEQQAQMNPLLLISCLLPHFKVYEHTEVFDINNQVAYTKEHYIKAKHIIVTTGYPFLKIKGLYPLKLTQKKSYVAVVDQIEAKENFNSIGCFAGDLYFRTYKDKLILGGNDQKTGSYVMGFKPLLQYIEKYYPTHPISYQWVNQDCVSADGLPYIGSYFKHQNVYVATGFNLWGMTGSMIASKLLFDLVERNKNKYEKLFTPQRRSPILPITKNILTAGFNLLLPKKRCTHLGCALFFNEEEQVYECPCHGTKYTKNGEVIFNPASKNKDISE